MIGIGASAGGLESIEDFFKSVPSEPNAAFIVIQHLSPDFKSFMPEILSKKTNLNVMTAKDGVTIEANTIYLLPPKMNMVVSENKILLTKIIRSRIPNKPIDLFFHSLGKNYGRRSYAIILSGTGSDGALGIKTVNDSGGHVFVESLESAKFDGMPNAALATNIYEGVADPEEICRLIFEDKNQKKSEAISKIEEQLKGNAERIEIFKAIEDKYAVDFNYYKIATVNRRIDKRLGELNLPNITQYRDYLLNNEEEVANLYYDMLVGVTAFFRDPEAFVIAQEEVAKIIAEKENGGSVRVWSAGCASGEEVYSMAMIFMDEIAKSRKKLDLKIFATDIDDEILGRAAEGIYGEEQVEGVPKHYINKYFFYNEGIFKVLPEVRNKIVFARHNVMDDPPFTKLDLISCRNLLIYLDTVAQKRVLSLFFFSLKTNAVLFLGPSESLGKYEAGYSTVSSKWKIFVKVAENKYIPTFPIKKQGNSVERELSVVVAPKHKNIVYNSDIGVSINYEEAYHTLLEEYVPPSLLTDESLNIIHVYGNLPVNLELKPGRISNNLRSFLDDALCTAVSICIQRAKKEKVPVEYKSFVINQGKEKISIDFKVSPLVQKKKDHVIYFLINMIRVDDKPVKSKRVIVEKSVDLEQVSILEEELQNTKEYLQSTIEELETTNEELQSTNEELLASNEELQSTNEELHSVNEELFTVNAEYHAKIEELNLLSLDEENFFKSTGVGTIFLDSTKRIRKFTPAAAESINLLEQDIGRPFNHFSHSFSEIVFDDVIDEVLKSNEITEVEVENRNGHPFLVKFLPYSNREGDVDGIVISFISIETIKDAMDRLRRSEALLKISQSISQTGSWQLKVSGRKLMCSDTWQSIHGMDRNELLLDEYFAIVYVDDLFEVKESFERFYKGDEDHTLIHRILKHDTGEIRWVKMNCTPLYYENGEPSVLVGSTQDITEFVTGQKLLESQNKILNFITEETNDGWWDWNLKEDYEYMSSKFWTTLGVDPKTKSHHPSEWKDLIHPDDLTLSISNLEKHISTKGAFPYFQEVRYKHTSGRWVTIICRGKVVEWDDNGEAVRMIGVHTDISKLKEKEQELTNINNRLERSNNDLESFAYITSHDLKAPLRGIYNLKTFIEEDLSAYFQSEMEGKEEVKKHLERLEKQAERMEALIKAIMAYSKSEYSTGSDTDVNVESLINDIADDLQVNIGNELILESSLPQLKTDQYKLFQVLSNLISNGLKYNPNKSEAKVFVSCKKVDKFFEFHVRDNGQGIDNKHHDKIFEMFQTLKPKDSFESSGIGLTLVKRIVEFVGGKVGLISSPGKGSDFTFTWPINN